MRKLEQEIHILKGFQEKGKVTYTVSPRNPEQIQRSTELDDRYCQIDILENGKVISTYVSTILTSANGFGESTVDKTVDTVNA